MTALVSDAEARLTLRLGPAGDAEEDADLASKIAQASAIFLNYHNDGAVPDDWLDDDASPPVLTVPEDVKAAVLIVLCDLWDRRGEDPTERAYNLMRMLRGPGLA